MSAPVQLPLDGVAEPDGGVVAARSDAIYGVHAYHTKVPPEAIRTFIERHTDPGDLVADPFCGSGMTGVAAAAAGRRAFLNDLSPAAVHIASNYNAPCDPAAFEQGVSRVLGRVGAQIESLYTTVHEGREARIEYLVWSDVRRCPNCKTDIVLWNHREEGLRRLRCSSCDLVSAKVEFAVVGEKAVEANLSLGTRRRVVRPAEEDDLGRAVIPDELPWTPSVEFGRDRPMWRRGHEDLGIRAASDFYSRRNLAGLALLWDAASEEPDERVRSALRFSLTAIANRASRRYQWNAKRPTNVLGGTLYVSSLRYEWNVLSLWRRKTSAVLRLFRDNPIAPDAVTVHSGSATRLPLADGSVDYCFTDPPFGAHIVYSDASLLWEAWLDSFTDRQAEAIVVSGGDNAKSVDDYQALIAESFREIHRVLKPDGKVSVVFQATDPAVWLAIQHAAAEAKLALVEATTLDKGQPSFKQIKGQSGSERVAVTDIVLTLTRAESPTPSVAINPLQALRRSLNGTATPITKLYATVNARLLESGTREIVTFDDLLALLREHCEEADGAWRWPA